MPIDNVKHSIHIRRKKNDVVFRNIARLWQLSHEAKSYQDLLDGLHPWNGPITLKFENNLPLAIGIMGCCMVLTIFVAPDNGWFQLMMLAGLLCIFCAYLIFEHQKPLTDVIRSLELDALSKKYNLRFQEQPKHISMPLNSLQFIGKLKNMFPLFDRGTLRNEILHYASTEWTDENGKTHPVLVYQYHYVNEIQVRDRDGDRITVREVHKDLWGVFVFDMNFPGLAVTTSNKRFDYPYAHPWHSSDIRTNQKIKISGSDPMQMAKQLSPAFILRLSDFFDQRQGDLLFHPEQHVLCYLGSKDLFKVSSSKRKIEDISTLRGHLRTFKIIELEKLQRDLTQFLQ